MREGWVFRFSELTRGEQFIREQGRAGKCSSVQCNTSRKDCITIKWQTNVIPCLKPTRSPALAKTSKAKTETSPSLSKLGISSQSHQQHSARRHCAWNDFPQILCTAQAQCTKRRAKQTQKIIPITCGKRIVIVCNDIWCNYMARLGTILKKVPCKSSNR